MSSEIYTKLKEEILPILKYEITQEKEDHETIEFVITIKVHGSLIRLKKFKDDEFLYIDGFIYLLKPITETTMLTFHSMVDNDIMVGINVDSKEGGNDDMIRNILMHIRIYKDEVTVSNLDRKISIIYNCMNKIGGAIMSATIMRNGKNGVDNSEDLKSYG